MFGQYLVNRGLLSEEDLLEALERQSRMQLSFGRLAYQMGLMTLDQVMETLRAQRGTDQCFCSVAVAHEFLESRQVKEILEQQGETFMPLGQVLATLGYIDPETLDRELKLFELERKANASASTKNDPNDYAAGEGDA